MKCIILAAGIGRRLRPLTINVPKCLLKLDGMTIIERCMSILKDHGIKEFVVVVGRKGTCWTKEAHQMIKNLPYKITIVINEENTETGSAYSLSLALEYVEPPVLVVDGDVVFSSRLIDNLLLKRERREQWTYLISRPAKSPYEKGGRVILDGNKVIAIGINVKGNFPWNIYSGIIAIGKALFHALKKEVSKSAYRTAEHVDVLNKLCKKHLIYNINDHRWVNVNTPDLYLTAKKVARLWDEEEQYL